MKKNRVAKILEAGIILTLLTICAGCFLSACNYNVLDTTYDFDYAVLTLPNGEIREGRVQSWRDYEDGDQIQVKINDAIYLVHSSNVVLIKGTEG